MTHKIQESAKNGTTSMATPVSSPFGAVIAASRSLPYEVLPERRFFDKEPKEPSVRIPLFIYQIKELLQEEFFYLVGRDGFEPSKAVPADLQSAPFGHSGTYP